MAEVTSNREVEDIRRTVAAFVAAGADEQVQRVITSVHGLSRQLNRWYDRQLGEEDISSGEWTALGQLARTDGDDPLTPTQLAAACNIAPSSMTHRLDRLAAKNLIDRVPDEVKRTRVLVRLTDAGYEFYARVIREADLVEADVLAGLDHQQISLLADLLETVIAGLDAAEV